MSESVFHFKQFTINQDKCAMKVGTDAVLLGAWVKIDSAKFILDIGTGTGIIALMIAQKAHNAIIDAIDVEEGAYLQASENVSDCDWKDRINVKKESLQSYALHKELGKQYDLIVSNPPYFVDASKPNTEARTTARHTDANLSFDELINGVLKLIKPDGRFCAILPYTEGYLFIEKAEKANLFCNYILKVKTKKEKK
jgi:tRNA1Val (adenine37-N6)-methyltransferase